MQNNECETQTVDIWPDRPVLAMAYVMMQRLGTMYSPELALRRGTLFPELYKPFCGETITGGAGYVV